MPASSSSIPPLDVTTQLALVQQSLDNAARSLKRMEADGRELRADIATLREEVRELQTARAAATAAAEALDRERERAQGAGAHWAQWVGVAASVLCSLAAAAWTLYHAAPGAR